MWVINNHCAMNLNKMEYFYINQVSNLIDNSYEIVTDTDLTVIGCLTKAEAEYVFNAITYAIDIGYGKINVLDALDDYKQLQEKARMMEKAANE